MRALVLILGAAARVALADAFSHSPYAPERAFCASAYTLAGDTLRVESLDPVPVRQPTPLSVAFTCPAGTLPAHVHTGAQCTVQLWACWFPETPLPCAPSATDRAAVVTDRAPFGIVACRDGTVVAWRAVDE